MTRGRNEPGGFRSPAEDYFEEPLDLAAYLVTNPAATYFMRVRGDATAGAGVLPGDLLVVDRSAEPVEGRLVVAKHEGRLVVRYLRQDETGALVLKAGGPAPQSATADPGDYEIWGVVTHTVHSF